MLNTFFQLNPFAEINFLQLSPFAENNFLLLPFVYFYLFSSVAKAFPESVARCNTVNLLHGEAES